MVIYMMRCMWLHMEGRKVNEAVVNASLLHHTSEATSRAVPLSASSHFLFFIGNLQKREEESVLIYVHLVSVQLSFFKKNCN